MDLKLVEDNLDGPLRAACEVLGIGKSGGKQTVFARIEQHLKTQELLQQHAFQTDGVPPPLEQKFAEEPPAEQRRRHELSHVSFADWCPHCVKFRAKADKHVSSKPEVRNESVCSIDFACTGRSLLELPLLGSRGLRLRKQAVKRQQERNCVLMLFSKCI